MVSEKLDECQNGVTSNSWIDYRISDPHGPWHKFHSGLAALDNLSK